MLEENQDSSRKSRRMGRPLKSESKKMRKFNGKSKEMPKHAYIRKIPVQPKEKPTISEYKKKLIQTRHDNKVLICQTIPKAFNNLRFIGPLLRYCCVKYGVSREDFTLAINMYNSSHFVMEDFNRASIINSGTFSVPFKRFIAKGYLVRITKTIVKVRKGSRNKIVGTDKLRLSLQMVKRVEHFYDIFNEIEILNNEDYDPFLAHPKIIMMVNKMEREIKDILSGKKKQEKIVVVKDVFEEE
jgi:hypothetical protein